MDNFFSKEELEKYKDFIREMYNVCERLDINYDELLSLYGIMNIYVKHLERELKEKSICLKSQNTTNS
jgi:hypothetical protein